MLIQPERVVVSFVPGQATIAAAWADDHGGHQTRNVLGKIGLEAGDVVRRIP